MAHKSASRWKTTLTVAQRRKPCDSDGSAEYEIDLSKKNARAFRKGLSQFVEHARKAGRAPSRRAARTSANRQRSGDVRAWAKTQGIKLSERGRIPASVVQQYEAAANGR